MEPLTRVARKASVAFTRNKLVRPTDRAESALLWLTMLVAAIAIPLTATVGSIVYDQHAAAAELEQTNRHQLLATLREDAPSATDYTGAPVQASTASAYWQAPNGATRIGVIGVPSDLHSGDTTPVWVDQAGNPVAQPRTSAMAASDGTMIAISILVGTAAVLACVQGIGVFLLRRRSIAAVEREWQDVEPRWTGRIGKERA